MSSMLQQIILDMVKQFSSLATDLIEGKVDLSQMVLASKQDFRSHLCQLISQVLEEKDQVIMASSYRRQFYRIKDKRERTFISSIGPLVFTRRYYEDKRTNERLFLLDEMAGIEKHSRLSLDLKAELLEDATRLSYKQSGERHGGEAKISKSAVMHVVHHSGKDISALDQLEDEPVPVPETLFVEADEDHVPHQDGTNHFLKMVYVHEGYRAVGKKFSLIRPFYITGEYPGTEGTEEIWQTVLDCIMKQYGGQMPKRFFLAGDGANWIKTGAGFLPNCTLVYDKFHLRKACKQAAVGVPGNLGDILMSWAMQGHSSYLNDYFRVRLNDPQLRPSERKTVLHARTLIRRNWKQIQANHAPGFHGTSAEGHISHMLSERFSSRPMGWSQAGTDSLSQTRVFVFQGGHVFEKLEANAKHQHKAKIDIRIDDRIKVRYKSEMAKYAQAVEASFVELASGRHRGWQYGITH